MSKKVLICAGILALMVAPAMAQGATAAPAADSTKAYLGLAIGFAMALAAFGGAIGQSRATAAAAEAVARQPEAGGRIQTMMIIGLALIETLVLYMFVIAFVLNGHITAH